MFKRIEAGLHRARHADVTYELQREPAGTRNRQWKLYRGTGDGRSYLESGLASVAEGARALDDKGSRRLARALAAVAGGPEEFDEAAGRAELGELLGPGIA